MATVVRPLSMAVGSPLGKKETIPLASPSSFLEVVSFMVAVANAPSMEPRTRGLLLPFLFTYLLVTIPLRRITTTSRRLRLVPPMVLRHSPTVPLSPGAVVVWGRFPASRPTETSPTFPLLTVPWMWGSASRLAIFRWLSVMLLHLTRKMAPTLLPLSVGRLKKRQCRFGRNPLNVPTKSVLPLLVASPGLLHLTQANWQLPEELTWLTDGRPHLPVSCRISLPILPSKLAESTRLDRRSSRGTSPSAALTRVWNLRLTLPTLYPRLTTDRFGQVGPGNTTGQKQLPLLARSG